MAARLVPVDGGPAIEIQRAVSLVGRRDFCDILLVEPSISKAHLLLVKSDGILLVRDLGSTNGTLVNGRRIRRAALLDNDQLSIAQCAFRVEYGGPKVEGMTDHTGESGVVVRAAGPANGGPAAAPAPVQELPPLLRGEGEESDSNLSLPPDSE